MRPRIEIQLRHFFAATVLALAALLGILFYLVWNGSRGAITEISSQLQGAASAKVLHKVDEFFSTLDQSVADFETQLAHGLLRPDDLVSIERYLYATMLGRENLTALTFTYGTPLGYRAADAPAGGHERGDLALAPTGRGQLTVYRVVEGDRDRLYTRHIHEEGGRWVVDTRARPVGGGFDGAPFVRDERAVAEDPTRRPSFTSPANQRHRGQLLWSDLAYSQLDETLPEPERRKVLSVQRAIFNPAGDEGRFLGVFQAGILSDEIERIIRQRVNEADPNDPHLIFLCDTTGRLITRVSPRDRIAPLDEQGRPDPGGDLRVVSEHLPAPITAVMKQPTLHGMAFQRPLFTRLRIAGDDYLLTLTALPPERPEGWVLGIIVPEAYYLARLEGSRHHLLLVSLVIMAGILLGGLWSLRTVRSGLGLIVARTDRMHRFEFDADSESSLFYDVNTALCSIEQAKTALRAMGKYVPIDLVRQLYEARREPALGGELLEVSLLFSDIKDFTKVSEELDPNALAVALGRYLEVMVRAIRGTEGTIDKYIGDAVMVMWNAPLPCERHTRRACEAALGCTRALEALFQSPAWRGIPPWHTRFGLHRDTVSVGHFGSPERLSYTAIGDGVNLASRLEGLNKLYGTWILVSATIREGAGEDFLFRRLDRVAVKGRSKGIEVYELVGWAAECAGRRAVVERYEAALAAYFGRRFGEALALVEAQESEDAPSQVLAERCRHMLAEPPPEDWDGIYVAKEK